MATESELMKAYNDSAAKAGVGAGTQNTQPTQGTQGAQTTPTAGASYRRLSMSAAR